MAEINNFYKKMDKIINYLDVQNIEYSVPYNYKSIYAETYPKDIRIFYTDAEIVHKNGGLQVEYNGKFRYDVSYTIWNRCLLPKKKSFKTQKDVIKFLKYITDLFNRNYDQLSMFGWEVLE